MIKLRKNKKVIVTGATGFIGSHLVPILLNNGYSVVAIGRDKAKAQKFSWIKNVTFLELDINKEIKGIKINQNIGVIHLAWDGLPNYKSLFHIEKNLPTSYNFLKSLVSKGVRHILVSGTCLEYGKRSGAIKSASPCKPNNPYGYAKDALHKQLLFYKDSTMFTLQWARLFYVYGDGQNANSIISQLDKAINDKQKFFNMSGGEQLRDYLPVEEVANQLFNLYISKKNGVFNICSGKPISIKQLVENHLKKRKAKIKLILGYYPYTDYEPMEFWGVKSIQNFK